MFFQSFKEYPNFNHHESVAMNKKIKAEVYFFLFIYFLINLAF